MVTIYTIIIYSISPLHYVPYCFCFCTLFAACVDEKLIYFGTYTILANLSPTSQKTIKHLQTWGRGRGNRAEQEKMERNGNSYTMLNGIIAKICSCCLYKWFWQSLTNLLENYLPISERKPTLLTMFMNNFVTLKFSNTVRTIIGGIFHCQFESLERQAMQCSQKT